MSQNFSLEKRLYDSHKNYLESTLKVRRIKHADILLLINKIETNKNFTVSKIGASEQNRDIYLVKIGHGKTKVFLWSQMHGDEPTATMALFDIFNFFSASDEFDAVKKEILDSVTIYFIPMVNPDGAEAFQRRNFFHIDINRDYLAQQSAEGRMLKSVFDSIKPDFGFNLHDQGSRYSVGRSPKTAAISLLAPAFNQQNEVNPVRERAIKLIGYLTNVLSVYVPGHISKYDDEFEPRAFGDNFQKSGASTVLIESGGWTGDPEKQYLRRLNFVAILSAINAIAKQLYAEVSPSVYADIPFNNHYIYDLLIRNLTIKKDGKEAKVDIAVNRHEVNTSDSKSFFYRSVIEDVGDTLGFYGAEEYDLNGLEVTPGKVYPREFDSLQQLAALNFEELYAGGYLFVKVKNLDTTGIGRKYSPYPINIITDSFENEYTNSIEPEEPANFVVYERAKVKFACVNGFLFDLQTRKQKILNGSIIFKKFDK